MVSHVIDAGPTASPAARADRAAREVLDHIRRIVRALREGSRAAERTLGLSAAQVFVLQRLAAGPALSVKELAARTLTHQSSVSVVVSKLCARGLVARATSALDARQSELTLTRQGRALVDRAPVHAPQDRLIAGLALIGPASRRRLAAELRRLVEAMALADADVDGPAPMFFEDGSSRGRSPGKRRRAPRA